MLAGTAATAPVTAATAAADASTRPTASTITGRHTARRSRQGSSSLAAYSNGGSTTRLTTSGATRTAGSARQQASRQPRDHQQRGSRDAQPSGESRDHRAQDDGERTVSTLRMPLTSPSRPADGRATDASRGAPLAPTQPGAWLGRRPAVRHEARLFPRQNRAVRRPYRAMCRFRRAPLPARRHRSAAGVLFTGTPSTPKASSTSAWIVPPTSQNQASIEDDPRRFAAGRLDPGPIST